MQSTDTQEARTHSLSTKAEENITIISSCALLLCHANINYDKPVNFLMKKKKRGGDQMFDALDFRSNETLLKP